jgi:hypothetical protein
LQRFQSKPLGVEISRKFSARRVIKRIQNHVNGANLPAEIVWTQIHEFVGIRWWFFIAFKRLYDMYFLGKIPARPR